MQAVIALYILIKMASELRFNPSVHRVKGDRLVCARGRPVCDSVCQDFKEIKTHSTARKSLRTLTVRGR